MRFKCKILREGQRNRGLGGGGHQIGRGGRGGWEGDIPLAKQLRGTGRGGGWDMIVFYGCVHEQVVN